MEEQSQAPVEQSEETRGSEVNEQEQKDDLIPYSTYQKALKEKKNTQSKMSEYELELKRLREEKLEREGKQDELLTNYRKELETLRGEKDKLNQTYAWNTLTGEIEREAMKNGCKDPKKLIRLMDDNDLKSINIGEDFSIDKRSLADVIEKSKKENHFLFETSSKAAAPGRPSNKPIEEQKTDLSKLSREELHELYKKHYK